jgi:hypothetical protein
MAYPEKLLPLRLFDVHLPKSRGMSTVQNIEDFTREVLIRYPQVRPDIEQTMVSKAEEPNVDLFARRWSEWGEHTYLHNHQGFRDTAIEFNVDTCYYGCSQTYAMGVPKAARYGEQLDRMTGGTSNNFGICGNSIDETLQLFMATSNFIKMKRAVFNFPDIARHTAPFNDDKNSGTSLYYNLMYTKHFKHDDLYKNHRRSIDAVYDAHFRLPAEYMFDRMRNTVQLIAYIGQLKGIEIVMTSWVQHAYEALMVFNRYPGTTWRLPQWVSPLVDIARDDLHFGVETHKAIAESIRDVL